MKWNNRTAWVQRLAAVALAAALLAGCRGTAAPAGSAVLPPESQSAAVGAEPAPEPLARCVQVDGVLYWDTGLLNQALRCGMMDGEITSAVEPGEQPRQDGQSNFGTGLGYQRGMAERTVEVYIEDEGWVVFAEEGADRGQIARQIEENEALSRRQAAGK